MDILRRLPSSLQYVLVSLAFGAVATLRFARTDGLVLYDGWYHLQRAELFPTAEFFTRSLPTAESVLQTTYADLHWLYHALLKPFTWIAGVTGFKAAHVIIVALTGAALYTVVSHYDQDKALLITSLSMMPWLFFIRLTLPRSISLGLLLFLLGAYFTITERTRLLGVTAAVYAAAYTSWLFLAYAMVIYHVLTYIDRGTISYDALLPYGGFAVGLAVNPFFPANVQVTAYQLALSAVPGIAGAEWTALSVSSWLRTAPLLILATGFTAAAFPWDKEQIFWVALTATFAVLGLSTQRAITYLVPCLLVLTASTWPSLRPSRESIITALLITGAATISISAIHHIDRFAEQTPLNALSGCIDDANAHFERDATLLNAEWDDFPRLYAQTPFTYATGLDPRFTKLHNKTTYEDLIRQDSLTVPKIQRYGFDGVIERRDSISRLEIRLRRSDEASIVEQTPTCYVARVAQDE